MSCGLGGDLDRWRNQLGAGATLRLVRLGDHACDGEAPAQQRLQRRHGEDRRPEENDPHHSDRADAADTSLVKPVSSLCSRRHGPGASAA